MKPTRNRCRDLKSSSQSVPGQQIGVSENPLTMVITSSRLPSLETCVADPLHMRGYVDRVFSAPKTCG